MDMQSRICNPGMPRESGDGEAKGPRADGMARLREVAFNGAGETLRASPESTPDPRIQGIAAEEPAPEKTRASCLRHIRPVPQTDTGGRVENTKALERFTVKELGKLAP